MLIAADIPKFHWNAKHPWYSKAVCDLLLADKLVVTLNDEPVTGVFSWSVPDGFIKRHIGADELATRSKLPRNGLQRFKGKVRVFRLMGPVSAG